jgi:hypothetical protein
LQVKRRRRELNRAAVARCDAALHELRQYHCLINRRRSARDAWLRA